jgi:hypothetical protein
MSPENTTAPEKDKKPRHRSPNYPAIGLRSAVGKISAVFKEDGLAPSPKLAAFKHMGFDKMHGEAARVLSALKSFGLIEESNERIKLTQRGIDTVARPEGDAQHSSALREALVGPGIYRELIADYRQHGLPSDMSLKSELVAGKKFNPNSVDGFVRDFRDSLEFAGITDLSVLEFGESNEDEDMEISEEAGVTLKPALPVRNVTPSASPAAPPVKQQQPSAPGEIATPVGKDGDTVVFAHVRFSSEMRKEYVASLKKYLEYLETTLG